MKKYIIGGVIGAALASSITVHADLVLTTVQAYLWPTPINVNLNGKQTSSSTDIEVLNYKDTAYVPLRYISENLGATVKYWDDTLAGRAIFIDAADERNLTLKDKGEIVGMGNFYFAHGNRTSMIAQIKKYKEYPANSNLSIRFYDSEGTLLLKQWVFTHFDLDLGEVQTITKQLEGNIEKADLTKTEIEFELIPK
ncbi:stalk domain-containing protein [Paenibacillus puerhi]|uniref:stalk domain-containing protein n=1 Tax=Paenibacillus puerhi TaxID=2692622 RepID=UPI00135AE8B8|nr:stalk domain-containing protein [Paenibacillus puerhi]